MDFKGSQKLPKITYKHLFIWVYINFLRKESLLFLARKQSIIHKESESMNYLPQHQSHLTTGVLKPTDCATDSSCYRLNDTWRFELLHFIYSPILTFLCSNDTCKLSSINFKSFSNLLCICPQESQRTERWHTHSLELTDLKQQRKQTKYKS